MAIAGVLWMALEFPCLAMEVFHHGHGGNTTPFAVYHGRKQRQRLYACNRAAMALGIRPGMALATALSLHGGLRALLRNEQKESETLRGLAGWAGRFTPCVSIKTHHGLLLEVEGSVALFGGIVRLQQQIELGLADMGHHSRSGTAPTPQGAWLLARAGHRQAVTDLPKLAAILSGLPVSLLEIPHEAIAALHDMGVERISDLVRLPRHGLAGRLGKGVLDCLDCLLGRRPDPQKVYVPPPSFHRRLPLACETANHEALIFAIHRLLMELSGLLVARHSTIETLRLQLFHAGSTPSELAIRLARPARDPVHLLHLLRERLQGITLPAPVQALSLHADQLLPFHGANPELLASSEPGAKDWRQLLERLQARLGQDAVYGLDVIAEHRPERAWRPVGPGDSCGIAARPPLRPLWLLDPPETTELVTNQPCRHGALRLTTSAERIEGGWWDGNDISRDYFIAENCHGERFWIFREAGGRWFVHGIFA